MAQHQFPLQELRQTLAQIEQQISDPNLPPQEAQQFQADMEQIKKAAAQLNQKLAEKRRKRGR